MIHISNKILLRQQESIFGDKRWNVYLQTDRCEYITWVEVGTDPDGNQRVIFKGVQSDVLSDADKSLIIAYIKSIQALTK